jgi:hypothetical protein
MPFRAHVHTNTVLIGEACLPYEALLLAENPKMAQGLSARIAEKDAPFLISFAIDAPADEFDRQTCLTLESNDGVLNLR